MKTKSRLFLILFLIVTLLATSVFATEETPSEDAVVTSEVTDETETDDTSDETETTEESIESTDKYFTGDEILIDTLIDGNAFAIGKNVTLTGQIGGDLFVIAETLTIDGGSVYGSVFVTAAEVTINGQLYDLYVASDKLTIEYDGYIYRDLKAMSTEISINGIIGRNTFIETDTLDLQSDCIIQGNLNYTSQAEASYPESGIKGDKNFTQASKKLFKKEIRKTVENILKTNKIGNDTSEDNVRAIIMSYAFNGLNIKTNSESLNGVSKNSTVPALYFYIAVAVIIVLVVLLLLPKINKSKENKATVADNKVDEQ